MATTLNKKFRVLVVDDSAFMRKVLEAIFNADDQRPSPSPNR
jgi:chemotaxis response regulator CheB